MAAFRKHERSVSNLRLLAFAIRLLNLQTAYVNELIN